jgi:hypothetical protein
VLVVVLPLSSSMYYSEAVDNAGDGSGGGGGGGGG